MSVTISIANNSEYCEEHGLVETSTEECLCTSAEFDRPPEPNCHYCKGSGEWVERHLPFEMGVANGNFATLWSALGLDHGDYCGSADGRTILSALRVGSEILIKDGSETRGKMGALFIDCGIRPEQAARYFSVLAEIAEEAVRREEPVCWG